MIDRIVLTKLSHPDQRAEIARQVQGKLHACPQLHALQVGLPGDAASARSWDLSLVLTCTDVGALDVLMVSPALVEVLELLEARSECVKAWSFERI